MRVLGIGSRLYLGDIYLALEREGHECRVFASDPLEQRAFGGILQPVDEWRAELGWVGKEGIILFEQVGQGMIQDALRADGYRVIGGSAFGDKLELDRAFGQSVLASAGLKIAASTGFPDATAALDWLAGHPGCYVLKHNDNARTTIVGEHRHGADIAYELRRSGPGGKLLMERLNGVEVGVGAYFDGHSFLRPACIDFEHKRFFPGEMGEMTGEMGTLASFEHSEILFEMTLARMEGLFAAAGHVGYVNLNLIADERGVWPLEFTCRFGNPGFAVLAALQRGGWGDLLTRMADGGTTRFDTAPGWSVAIVLTVPPFPGVTMAVPEDDPPLFFHTVPVADIANYHFVDMRRDGDQLLVHRRSGHAMIVTGIGPDVASAQEAARSRARNVIVPEIRWRSDIGDRFVNQDRARLHEWGLLPACELPGSK